MSKMNIVNTKLSISGSTRILEIPRGAGYFRAERENPARRGIKPARARAREISRADRTSAKTRI